MSGIDLTDKLVETTTKVITTVNEYGDVTFGNITSSACLYRDISSLNQIQNRNEIQIDGILWFGASEIVARGDIYYHPDEGYLQITRVTRAKRLVADNSLKFIRCEVIKQRQIS